MTISVSQLEGESFSRLPVREGQHVEFKVSAFHAPLKSAKRQIETIAREIAAFMNADGGELFLGVDDDGLVTGIKSDLDALSNGLDETIVRGPGLDDSSWVDSFRIATYDAYGRKINQIAQGYLGKSACQWLGDADFQQTDNGLVYVRIPILRAANGEVVLFQSGQWSELWVRTQGRMQCFKDRDRDQFVMRKARELAAKENSDYQKNTETKLAALMEAVSQMKRQQIPVDDISQKRVTPIRNDGVIGEPVEDAQDDLRAENIAEKMKIIEDDDYARRLKEIKESFAQAKEESRLRMERFIQTWKAETRCLVCRRGYDLRSSSTSIMDEFDLIEDGKFKYNRLELYHFGEGLSFIPYGIDYVRDAEGDIIGWRSGYKRLGNYNFRISKIELLIERCECADAHLAGRGFSFSDLKKSLSGDLSLLIWDSINQSVMDADAGSHLTVMLKKPIEFRAHTSDSFDSQPINVPRRYKVVGVRFVKGKLFFCPEHLTDNEHAEFEKINMDAAVRWLRQAIEEEKAKGS